MIIMVVQILEIFITFTTSRVEIESASDRCTLLNRACPRLGIAWLLFRGPALMP